MTLNKSLKATYGLDASNEKVINVGLADKNTLTDGVNVEFLIQENTIQAYDKNRGYEKGFAVIFENRIYVSNQKIESPAGDFEPHKWFSLRVDPKWDTVFETVASGQIITSGQFIAANTSINDLYFKLPRKPQPGDTICIKEVSGNSGYKFLKIGKTDNNILWNGTNVEELYLTRPYSQTYFIFSGNVWNVFQIEHEDIGRIISTSPLKQQVSSGERLYRLSNTGPINIMLPKYAMHGDVIEMFDIDGLTSINHLTLYTSEGSGHAIGTLGQSKLEIRTIGNGRLVFDSSNNLWRLWDGDIRTRLKTIKEDRKLLPNEQVLVYGMNNTVKETVTLTLPRNIAVGDTVEISLGYMRKGQTVIIKTEGDDIIGTDKTLLQFPKRSQYPPEMTWVEVKELVFNGTDDYLPYLKFAYVETLSDLGWAVQHYRPNVERVDFKNPERIGLIALATQDQANKDHENNPEKELAVTPFTLANRVATEERRGIAKTAKTSMVNQNSNGKFEDDTIVTPKKLNERTATEERRGLAEIATQEETNTGKDDTTIVSPLKLENRKASETLSGIAKIVPSKGTPGTQRDKQGTGVYNYTDNKTIVSPSAIHELLSTENSHGVVYLASETEVIEAPDMDPKFPVAVTPVQLHKKTATEDRIGFSQIATQEETDEGTDNFKFITPKKLNDRRSTETLEGISRYATYEEFKKGDSNLISEPNKIKQFLQEARIKVVPESGIVFTGNIWDTCNFDIKPSTEVDRGTLKLSTQGQANTGEDDTTAITPKKLHNKKSTELVEGIIQLSNYAETIAGDVNNKAISPQNFVLAVQTENNGLEASTSLRGFVRLLDGASIWQGTDESGSDPDNEDFLHNGYAVSPRELNKALSHYLPIKGKAVNSTLFDDLKTSDFIRRNIDQEIDGDMTFNNPVILKDTLVSTSSGKFESLESKTVSVGDGTKGSINFLSATPWKIDVQDDFKINNVKIDKDEVIHSKGLETISHVDTSEYRLNGKTFISGQGTINVGDAESQIRFQSKNPNDVRISGSTIIVNTNLEEKGNKHFINRKQDTVDGDIEFTKPVKINIQENMVEVSEGIFVAKITSKQEYEKYPGIAVPKIDQETQKVIDYTYVKGPGTLTQYGDTKSYTYRIWAPQALGQEDNHNNYSLWMQVYNPVKGEFDAWGRIYTSQNPPTAAEIGAVSSSGSTFETLKVNQWLQVGPVRMVPDPVTKTVRYIWIDE
ncbi:long tail fiber proximal subunit [Shigella phage vB_SdyM_006]|nr:long tail fiber proximal subunit [Shigella phage vB_SdyM_006]